MLHVAEKCYGVSFSQKASTIDVVSREEALKFVEGQKAWDHAWPVGLDVDYFWISSRVERGEGMAFVIPNNFFLPYRFIILGLHPPPFLFV